MDIYSCAPRNKIKMDIFSVQDCPHVAHFLNAQIYTVHTMRTEGKPNKHKPTYSSAACHVIQNMCIFKTGGGGRSHGGSDPIGSTNRRFLCQGFMEDNMSQSLSDIET